QETAVRHLVRERMFECVLNLWEQSSLVEELGCLKTHEAQPERFLSPVTHNVDEVVRHVLSNDGCRLKQTLVLREKSVNAGGEDCGRRRRHLEGVERLRQSVRATLTCQHTRLKKCAHAFFKEEWIALCSFD